MILELGAADSWLARGAAALALSAHITAGCVGIASGAVALLVRKGSRLHGRAGTLFFGSILAMSAIGAVLSPFLPRPDWGNVVGGAFTFYLVATAWATVKRLPGTIGRFEFGAFLAGSAVAALSLGLGIHTANAAVRDPGAPPLAAYFVFGTIATIAAAMDLRLLVRGGVAGVARITRHLWRMCVALLIAVLSLFLGQQQVFPAALRGSPLLFLPELAVLGSLVFWMVRVRFGRRFRHDAGAIASPVGRSSDLVRTEAVVDG